MISFFNEILSHRICFRSALTSISWQFAQLPVPEPWSSLAGELESARSGLFLPLALQLLQSVESVAIPSARQLPRVYPDILPFSCLSAVFPSCAFISARNTREHVGSDFHLQWGQLLLLSRQSKKAGALICSTSSLTEPLDKEPRAPPAAVLQAAVGSLWEFRWAYARSLL